MSRRAGRPERHGRLPRTGDALIALAIFGLSLAGALALTDTFSHQDRPLDAWAVVLMAGVTFPLAWRQRAPRLVLWISVSFWMTYAATGYLDASNIFGPVIAMYSVALYVPRRQAIAHGTAVVAVTLGWTVLGILSGYPVAWLTIAQLLIALTVPFGIGLADSRRAARVVELELDQQRREQAQRVAAADAVRAERARIARELHDVVAHEITVMALQAEGAKRRVDDADPVVSTALTTISQAGRNALTEMQRIIGVLRASEHEASTEAAVLTGGSRPQYGAELQPSPSLEHLPGLFSQVRDAGLPVEYEPVDLGDLPASYGLTLYRLIQESLTNAMKYAGPHATATVILARRGEQVTVTVEDDGRGAIADAARTSGGHGIDGMRERVTALGGTLDVGTRRGGGFRVHATLPLNSPLS